MILGIIPARLKSVRLPNKPLIIIDGLPLIIHVLKRALMSKKIDKIIVCTDSIKVINTLKKYNYNGYLTPKNIKNGTDRISFFLEKNTFIYNKLKLVIDIQCDEIFLNPNYLDKAIKYHLENLEKFDVLIPHTLTNETRNKNYVKIVSNQNNKVIYLTRADAPFSFRSKLEKFQRHQDFVSFKPSFIKKFKNLKNRKLEKYEGIELLRVLENGYKIGTIRFKDDSFSINSKKDLIQSLSLISIDKFRKLYK